MGSQYFCYLHTMVGAFQQLNDDALQAPTFTSVIKMAVPLLFPGFLDMRVFGSLAWSSHVTAYSFWGMAQGQLFAGT